MSIIAAIFIGGGIGSLLRYGLTVGIRNSALWSIALVNTLGCFFFGLAMGYFYHYQHQSELKYFITTGLLGAFTTFSTWQWESYLLSNNNLLNALFYILLTTLIGFISLALGFVLIPNPK